MNAEPPTRAGPGCRGTGLGPDAISGSRVHQSSSNSPQPLHQPLRFSSALSAEICPSGQFFQTRGACKPEDSVVEVELVRDDVMNVKDVYISLIKLRLTETNALKVKLETGAE